MRALPTLVCAAVVCVSTATLGSSQVDRAPDAKALRFDVVSIRPSSSARGGTKLLPDGYEATGIPLESTLLLAYVPAPYFKHFDLVRGAPAWVSSESYDIRLKVAPADVAQWQSLHLNIAQTAPVLQEMLREVLAERCHLRIHGTDTMTDGYVLHLRGAKSPALVESADPLAADQGFALIDGARAVRSTQDGEQALTFYNTSMSILAGYLSFSSQYPMQDRTGLTGRYRFVLQHIANPPSEGGTSAQLEVPVPWNLQAVGLKVDREKVKATLWTVDSMEKPSPN